MMSAGMARFVPAMAFDENRIVRTPQRLHECPDCGLFQVVPPLDPGERASCLRCAAVLRQARHDPLTRALAFNLAALSLFGVACLMPLMSVSTAGMQLTADLFSGPYGLQRHGVGELALVVLFTTVAAPLLKLLSMTYVLLGLRMKRPPKHLRSVFGWVEWLRPWSMIEVYLLGVFVAFVKLRDLVHIDVGVATYALGALMLTMVAADALLDPLAVWEEIERRAVARGRIDHAAVAATVLGQGAVGCETCHLVSLPTAAASHCPRCASALHARKPNSVARTWALMIAATILYVPANVYPVLTVIQLGAGAPSTILGGVEELLASGLYPLAALVFFASILVPVLKLISLSILLICTQMGWIARLRDRTVLFRLVRSIGRWSMIDIFMESILIALVQFGSVVTIDPGIGAVAFAAVVILTMFAAESFDPRLMWDEASPARERSP
jgi:paraquat-inducible protein A